MVAVKAHQAEAFLKSPERVPPAVLFYGTDAGLVSERAGCWRGGWPSATAARCCASTTPTSRTNRPASASSCRPCAMFGGRKVVRALAGRRVNANALKPLVEGGNIEGFLIVEAGNLRPDEALRALFEKSAGAAAVACFPDEVRDLDAMVGEILRAAGMQIAPDAKRLLTARLGADRALSRAEVEKLALFARGKTLIEESRRGSRGGRCRGAGAGPHRAGRRSGRSADAVTDATAASPPARARRA